MGDAMGVWVFNGAGSRFAGAVFSSAEAAERWIAAHALTGILTWYPLDLPALDWAVREGCFPADRPMTPEKIGGFTSASQPHRHYEDGVRQA